jgi:hypothetical protein
VQARAKRRDGLEEGQVARVERAGAIDILGVYAARYFSTRCSACP